MTREAPCACCGILRYGNLLDEKDPPIMAEKTDTTFRSLPAPEWFLALLAWCDGAKSAGVTSADRANAAWEQFVKMHYVHSLVSLVEAPPPSDDAAFNDLCEAERNAIEIAFNRWKERFIHAPDRAWSLQALIKECFVAGWSSHLLRPITPTITQADLRKAFQSSNDK